MGSVIDYIECPNCKQEAYSDFYYKTGEEYINCSNCGYHYSATIINRDKNLNELTEQDWQIKELKNPFASFKIKYKNNSLYTLGSLVNQEEYDNFKKHIKEDLDIEFCSISRFIDDEIKFEILIDKKNTND